MVVAADVPDTVVVVVVVVLVAEVETVPLLVAIGVTVLEEGKIQDIVADDESLFSWVEFDAVAAVTQLVLITESISVKVLVLMEQHSSS